MKKRRSTRVRNGIRRRRAFFYAEADADVYDVAADLNTPLFSLMHATVLELVRQYRNSLSRGQREEDWVFLDVGSGTGAESIPLLREYTNSKVVALDLCRPMHGIFRAKVNAGLGPRAVKARCQFLTGDIAGRPGSPMELRRPLQKWGEAKSYDMIISALALHHLTHVEKRQVYRRLASVLKPGGLFINADLFSYCSPMMARMADEFGLNWIRRQFTRPDPQLRKAQQSLGKRASRLMRSWVEHCVEHNLPEPIESERDATPQSGSEIEGQARMLADAGFKEIACPFRYWQVGVLWAIK